MQEAIPPLPPPSFPLHLNPLQHMKKKMLIVIGILFLVCIGIIFAFQQGSLLNKKYPEKFKLVESFPEDYATSVSAISQPMFVFSKKIGVTESKIKDYVKITPAVNGSWHIEKNGQVLIFSPNETTINQFPTTFQYDTVYTITLNKTLRSDDGKILDKPLEIRFRTQKNNQTYSLTASYKLLNTFTEKPITVNLVYNHQEAPPPDPIAIHTSIQTATLDQLLEYVAYRNKKEPLYQFQKTQANKEIASESKILQQNITPGGYGDSHITLDPISTPGIYYVTVENSRVGKDGFFLVVTNHINTVFNETKNTRVWVATAKNGTSIPKATVRLYSVNGNPHQLSTGQTDSTGMITLTKGSKDADIVVSEANGSIAITKTATYEGQVWNTYTVFSYSDRPLYQPQDKVHYKAVIRTRKDGAYTIPTGDLYIRLVTQLTSSLETPQYQKLAVDDNGTVTYDIQLPKMTPTTYPSLVLYTKNGNSYDVIDTFALNIEPYRKPDLDITVQTNEAEYISLDTAHFTIISKTNYGKPLSNVPFSYRVLANDYTEVEDRKDEGTFSYYMDYYGGGKVLSEGTGTFDKKGKAAIEFSTDLKDFEPSQIVTLEVTPKIGASPSIAQMVKLVHRGEFALFFNTVSGDSEKGIVGEITALNQQKPRQPVANQSITLSLYNYNTDSTYTKTLLESKEATTSAEGTTTFSFSDLKEGNYELVVQGKDTRGNTVTNRYTTYITKPVAIQGNDQPTYTLSLTNQKESYLPGQQAEITAEANFPVANAVIVTSTYGGSGTYYRRNADIQTLTQQQPNAPSWKFSVPIGQNQIQALGVDIIVITHDTVVKGHTNLEVNTAGKQLTTTLSFNKTVVKPGEKIEAEITTKDAQGNPVSADNSLSLIDGSLLQIAQDNNNIFDIFYGPAANTYSYLDVYDSTQGILTQFGGGGGGGCFVGGTKILTKDHQLKNIEDMKIGDVILTRKSDISNQLVEDVITNTYRHTVDEYLTINDTLRVTPIHRMYINNQWQIASAAKIGDTLLDTNGNKVEITSIVYHSGQIHVYNLTTATYHTFFADGFYVHNDKGAAPRFNLVDTAYWNPHIKTDSNGKAHVTIALPDNLTNFVATTYSNTNRSQFGQAHATVIARKDINILPAVSQFYYEGDQPVVSALIQNASTTDFNGAVTLTVKDLGLIKKQSVTVKSGDFEQVSFPLNLGNQKNTVSFEFQAQEESETKDAILLKRPILPRGTIQPGWVSFDESKTYDITPQFPDVDFNIVRLDTIPHLAYTLMGKKDPYFSEASSGLGQQLYAWSYILGQTELGNIRPDFYQYAHSKNSLREATNHALIDADKTGTQIYWTPKYGNPLPESDLITAAWMLKGLTELRNNNLLSGISNSSAIINSVREYATDRAAKPIFSLQNSAPQPNILPDGSKPLSPDGTEPIPPIIINPIQQSLSDDTQSLLEFTGIPYPNRQVSNSLQFFAAKALKGDKKALDELRNLKIHSASDRYIWSDTSTYGVAFTILAMIENGSPIDAAKTIKGASIRAGINGGSVSDLLFLAAIKNAIKNHLLDQPTVYSARVNNTLLFDSSNKDNYTTSFSDIVPPASSTDKTIHIEIQKDGPLPIYTTISSLLYGTSPIENQAIVSPDQITRELKSVENGTVLSHLDFGQTGMVVLSFKNPYAYQAQQDQTFPLSSILSEDAISPAYLFLNQQGGNSPQYQGVLNTFFPATSQYSQGYMYPSNYSTQSVFFNGSIPPEQPITYMPYIVYSLIDGVYYQPKTSLIFPYLGIIINEK